MWLAGLEWPDEEQGLDGHSDADCVAHASGHPDSFPAKRQRKDRPQRYGVAWWIERDEDVWLVRRPARGLLGGMASLPGGDWTEFRSTATPTLATVRHVFTHFSLDLAVELRSEAVGQGWWHPIAELDQAGLPTLYLKAVREVLRGRRSLAA